jgi:hypothetical protein
VEELKKHKKNLNQDRWCLARDLNPEPPELRDRDVSFEVRSAVL